MNKENMLVELSELVDKKVVVAITSGGIVRRDFVSQISIEGKLEQSGTQFRVLRDNNTFCYFDGGDVVLINPLVSSGRVVYLDFKMERLEWKEKY